MQFSTCPKRIWVGGEQDDIFERASNDKKEKKEEDEVPSKNLTVTNSAFLSSDKSPENRSWPNCKIPADKVVMYFILSLFVGMSVSFTMTRRHQGYDVIIVFVVISSKP
mmetsp:Transcript_47993/g.58110  ORF Transcript_47993/g.58110 Transcript_47993/m.58110 type:complete len:109 (+) Transcript_47993:313-639(+)